jgi:organic radical activating enzyme
LLLRLLRLLKPDSAEPQALRLGLEITHRCNKMCPLCDHRIRSSDFDYLTLEQYLKIRSHIRPSQIEGFTIIGGEPLCHPFFEELMQRMLVDFPLKRIVVWTNGKLLFSLDPALLSRLKFVVTIYPGFNDEAARVFSDHKNIHWRKSKTFWDPYQDPNLCEEEARKAFQNCRFRKVRVVGTRLYNCCIAESIERHYQTKPVHVEFSDNWMRDYPDLPTWQACRHCFRAGKALRL